MPHDTLAVSPPFAVTASVGDSPPGLGFAYRFLDGGEAIALLPGEVLGALAQPGGWLWLHFDLSDPGARGWIAANVELPEAGRALLFSNDEHLALEPVEDGVAGVFSDLLRDTAGEERALGRLRFVLTGRLVVSGRREALGSIARTLASIGQGRRFTDAVALLEIIVEHFADAVTAVAAELTEALDAIEDALIEERPGGEGKKLGPVRRTAVRLHRQLSSLRLLFRRWSATTDAPLPDRLQHAVGRLGQRLDGLDQEIVGIQERARLLQDELANKLAAETNRHLFALSLLTAFLLPPTLLAGIFGMNLPDMPFAERAGGFWIAIAVSVVSGAAVYLLLRILRVMR
jgi:zinc transporter